MILIFELRKAGPPGNQHNFECGAGLDRIQLISRHIQIGSAVPLIELGEKVRVGEASVQRVRRLGIARIEGLERSREFFRTDFIIGRWADGFGCLRCGRGACQYRDEDRGRRSRFSRSQASLRAPFRSARILGWAVAPRPCPQEGGLPRDTIWKIFRSLIVVVERLATKRMVMMMMMFHAGHM